MRILMGSCSLKITTFKIKLMIIIMGRIGIRDIAHDLLRKKKINKI